MRLGPAAAALALAALGAAGVAQADPPPQAAACSVCHGALGLGQAPDAPHLAGQPAVYLVRQLRAYRDGQRRHEVMNVVAKPLSDDDIEALARWYSSIRVSAQPSP